MENKSNRSEERSSTYQNFTRRSFLKWSSAIAATGAIAQTVGCGLTEQDSSKATDNATSSEMQGEWIPAQCWADCGSRGFNKVLVVDGEMQRMGTDETVEDRPNCPRVRSCARGRAHRSYILGADRLKYPMKRKNWNPGGKEINQNLRGKDEWERITWDEALDYIASEIERIVKTYGNDAIVVPGFVPSLFGQWDIGRMLSLYGGYMDNWGACSSGAWGSIAPYIGLLEDYNDRLDMRNSELILLWGSNPAWSRAGQPTYHYLQCKKNGTKFISIDIFKHPSAQVLADDWLPVRPGTDVALALGMAYEILSLDEKNNNQLIDWKFLNNCCVGFDESTMPEGSNKNDNFKDYVLGTYDNQPKTPEWASEICGTPVEKIKEVARLLVETDKTAIAMSPAPSRTTNGVALPQTILALGAMSGSIGKSGCWTGSDAGHSWLMGGKSLVVGGNTQGDPTWFTPGGKELLSNPVSGNSISKFTGTPDGMYTRPTEPYERINVNELWTSVIDGEFTAGKNDKRSCNTRMFYHVHSNLMNQTPGTMLAIEAHRHPQIEFVVTQNLVMTTTAKYADIVLPIISKWESVGDLTQGYREQLLLTRNVIDPIFEAKSDLWVAEQIGKRLGVDLELLSPHSEEQELYNQLAAAQVINDNGEDYEPLLTITADDIEEMGVQGEPQEGRIEYKEFKEKGIFQVPRSEDDNFGHIVLEDFRNDPEVNPLNTRTGKLEIYSEHLAEDLNACGWSEIEPLAKYHPAIEGYEETFSNWETKEKGEYPFQLVSLHIPRFAHSTFGNVPILREAFDHPIYMNPLDAKSLNLSTGDDILVESKWGKVLRPLLLTDVMMPGVLGLGQGAWVEIDEETGIDIAGCVNVLNGPNTVGFGHQAWNSCIVKVEKWRGEPLTPDAQWKPRQPIKEA